jgi:hypothetical protein
VGRWWDDTDRLGRGIRRQVRPSVVPEHRNLQLRLCKTLKTRGCLPTYTASQPVTLFSCFFLHVLHFTVSWASQNGGLFTRSTTESVVSTADVGTADCFHGLIRVIITTWCPNLENEMIRPKKAEFFSEMWVICRVGQRRVPGGSSRNEVFPRRYLPGC